MIKFIKNSIVSSLLLTIVLLYLIFPAAATAQQAANPDPTPSSDLQEKVLPIPPPPLSDLEPKVSEQLKERASRFDAMIQDPALDRAARGRGYGELGLVYHAYELYESAEACYRNALLFDPDSYNWNYTLGYLLQKSGKFAEAIQYYLRTLNENRAPQETALINIRLGECYLGINNPQEAKQAFEKANTLFPDDPVSLARLGETAFKQKNYEDTVRYLESALEKQPEADKLHYTLAMAYRSLGKMDLARDHLAKRGKVGIQPYDPLIQSLNDFVTGSRVHVLNARMAFGAERYEDAAQLFRKAVEEQPEDAGCRVNLGVSLSKLGKNDEALEQFREAIRLDPNSITAHFNLGSLLLFQNKPDDALESLRFAAQKSPKDATAALLLANALMKTNQVGQSIDYYRKAIELDGSLIDAYLELSSLYNLINQPLEALQTLENAHALLPKDGPITHALARLLASSPDYRLRDGKRALAMALLVFRAQPEYDIAKTVAMAYAEMNLCDKAVTWMKTSINLATRAGEDLTVIRTLFRNMEHLDRQRPCRIP